MREWISQRTWCWYFILFFYIKKRNQHSDFAKDSKTWKRLKNIFMLQLYYHCYIHTTFGAAIPAWVPKNEPKKLGSTLSKSAFWSKQLVSTCLIFYIYQKQDTIDTDLWIKCSISSAIFTFFQLWSRQSFKVTYTLLTWDSKLFLFLQASLEVSIWNSYWEKSWLFLKLLFVYLFRWKKMKQLKANKKLHLTPEITQCKKNLIYCCGEFPYIQ